MDVSVLDGMFLMELYRTNCDEENCDEEKVHPASLGCRMRTTDTDTRVLITCAREPLHSYSGTLVSGCVCPPSLQCSAKKTNICCSKQDKGLADLWFWWSSKQGKDLTLVILSDHQNTCFCKKLVESV